MAAPLTAWTRRALDELADGAWHLYDDVVTAAALVVPPGRAYRQGEYSRQLANRRPNGPGPRVRGDRDVSVHVGARELARKAVLGLIRNGAVERDGDRIRRMA